MEIAAKSGCTTQAIGWSTRKGSLRRGETKGTGEATSGTDLGGNQWDEKDNPDGVAGQDDHVETKPESPLDE